MAVKDKEAEIEDIDISDIVSRNLIVYNDNHNSIQYVIRSFLEVLPMGPNQAEQCTWIIHYKGKCIVKSGSHDELKPYRDALTERGINAKII